MENKSYLDRYREWTQKELNRIQRDKYLREQRELERKRIEHERLIDRVIRPDFDW